MNDYKRRYKDRNSSGIRNRQVARNRRKQFIAQIKISSISKIRDMPLFTEANKILQKPWMMLHDIVWMFVTQLPVFKIISLIVLFVTMVILGSYLFTDTISPNVYSIDMELGGLTTEEAEAKLQTEWEENLLIDLTIDGYTIVQVTPAELGLSIDTKETVNIAKNLGFSSIPFGATVNPSINVDYSTAQSFLLDLSDQIYEAPYEAGYTWQDGNLIAEHGQLGQQLDIFFTLEHLTQETIKIVSDRHLELLTIELLPTVMDASPHLDEAYAFLTSDINLRGYDPFSHETITWQVDSKTASGWMASGSNGLTVREDVFVKYIRSINEGLINSESPRYLDERHSIEKIREALHANNPEILLRIRYLPQPYEIEQRDNGFLIGRKNGIPFLLISEANPAVNWNQLTIGQHIQIPSRDELIPEDPISNKRIIVDLETQWLVAFENDEIVFSWGISSGRDTAPTYPGVFQILTHNSVAYGSSYSLCNTEGTDCGQWEMNWFMGIYEVIPGLVNGFHGAVLLPNGGYLGGGGVSTPSTFGCVMSLDANANRLFEWAEMGTMVEILSEDFEPESELGRRALEFIDSIDTTYRPMSA